MFRVHFGKLRKNDFKRTISEELVKFNIQYIAAMKCITTDKELGKSGCLRKNRHFSHYVPILPPIPSKMFLE